MNGKQSKLISKLVEIERSKPGNKHKAEDYDWCRQVRRSLKRGFKGLTSQQRGQLRKAWGV